MKIDREPRTIRGVVRLSIAIVFLSFGCASRPPVQSTDGAANYEHVFGGLLAPKPTVVNSVVERQRKSILRIIPLKSEYTGLWAFEVIASRAWVEEVKRVARIPYSEIDFAEADLRSAPEWFRPTADKFNAWKLQGGLSYPRAHLFVEKEPESEERIRVFVKRY